MIRAFSSSKVVWAALGITVRLQFKERCRERLFLLINRQKQKGVAVLYVGEDLDVLLELADRILVLCGGKVSGIVPGRGAKKRDVGMMMTRLGGKTDNE